MSRAFVFVLPLLILGCVSAKARYERGLKLEAQGRYAEAVEYYAGALEKDGDLPGARQRLREAGEHASAQLTAEIEQSAAQQRFTDAAEAHFRLEALWRRTERVGVTLPRPGDYDARRRAALHAAVGQLLAEGERAEAAGRFEEAADRYARALDRYAPDPERAAGLRTARNRTFLRWAEADLDRHRYRAALERVERVLPGLGPDDPLADEAHALRAAILDRGTLHVALLPLWRTEAAARDLPSGLLDDLNDELADGHWTNAPLFLDVTDPAETRAEVRRLRYNRRLVTTGQAAEIGRALGVDLVVAGELDRFARAEEEVQEELRRDRFRESRDTSYTVRRGTLRLTGRVAYEIVDAATRRVVEEGSVDASVTDRFERGRFAGRSEDLDLTRTERRWFDRDAHAEQERALEEQLVNRLADRLAERLYDRLLRRVG